VNNKGIGAVLRGCKCLEHVSIRPVLGLPQGADLRRCYQQVCVYVCVYVCVCVCMYVCIHTYVCMYVCIHTYVCMYVCVCMYVYIYMQYVYIYIDLHTHTLRVYTRRLNSTAVSYVQSHRPRYIIGP